MAYNRPHRPSKHNIELHKIGIHQCPECDASAIYPNWNEVFGFKTWHGKQYVISWCIQCRMDAQ